MHVFLGEEQHYIECVRPLVEILLIGPNDHCHFKYSVMVLGRREQNGRCVRNNELNNFWNTLKEKQFSNLVVPNSGSKWFSPELVSWSYPNQIKLYFSYVPNITRVDFTVKC